MSMSKSSYSQYNRTTWEDADFPILCQTCLGDNPYMRMMKDKFGKECQICKRPFTNFRWCPGKGMRYKSTEVCQTCAKIKNTCQTCLLDLEYGLPVQVRDHALQLKDDIPKHGANRDYYVQNMEREAAIGDGTTPVGAVGRAMEVQSGKNELLSKLARTGPYYRRNLPHLCSFYIKGECKRGEECPYRHEKPTDPDDPLSEQNMRDRYYGSNDPVAEKMLNRLKAMPSLRPPEDKHVTTLYVGNLGDEGLVTDSDLRNYFYQFGEIRNINMVANKGIAFVEFTTREAAEMATNKAYNKLNLKNRRITVRWGRPQASRNAASSAEERRLPPVPGLPPPMDFFNLSSGSAPMPPSAAADTSSSSSTVLPSGWTVGVSGHQTHGDNADDSAAAKKARMSTGGVSSMPFAAPQGGRMPAPPMPPPANYPPAGVTIPPPRALIPTVTPAELDAKHAKRAAAGIHYPSQDPQHLGAKDLVD